VAFAAPQAPTAKTKAVAQKVYVQGTEHYKAGRLLEALAAFRASYGMVPSPNSHLMIARTLRDQGELVEAYVEYDKVVQEAEVAAKRDAKYRSAAEASRVERTKLRARLSMIIVRVKNPPDDVRIMLGDKPIDRDDWGKPVPVVAGALVARGVSAGLPEQRQDVNAPPGEELVVIFDYSTPAAPVAGAPEPNSEKAALPAARTPGVAPHDGVPDIPREPRRAPPAPDRTLGYALLGVGAVGFTTFAVFGALNQSTFNDLKGACPNGHCPSDRSGDVDRGRREQVIANIGLGVGIIGATVGIILFATGEKAGKGSDETARHGHGVALSDLSIGPGSVQLGGVF
jgi:hypothetical protein